ncbi:glycosyltransferase family 2 protein [Sporomusa sphaeroides]|uniref:glycosyltransferase family 2 protein n=1 Tax=Sporomusa sphaeroides TaxID=47679 RepID=UPI0031598E97
MGLSKVSVITVCYNSAKTLEDAIGSVVNQTYPNLEYIIIDGGSTDGTVDIIKKYKEKISYWISEPDEGIYDAMNKGLKRATGEWVYFLGSDDYLVSDHSFTDIFLTRSELDEFSVICGKVIKYDSKLDYGYVCPPKPLTYEDCRRGVMPPHQGMLMKRYLIEDYGGFSLEYKIAADLDLFIKFIASNQKIIFIDKVVACFSEGGMSSSFENKMKLVRERRNIIKQYRRNNIINYEGFQFLYYKGLINTIIVLILEKIGIWKIIKKSIKK